MDILHVLAAITFDTETDQGKFITVLLAYAIAGLGPVVGTYLFIKSSGKIFGMVAGGIGKVSKWGQKRTGGWAKNKYDRSTFGTGRAAQKAFKDETAKERAYDRMKRKTLRGRLAMAGVHGAARRRMGAYAEAQGDKLYKTDVENEQIRLGKNVENNAAAAVAEFRKNAKRGNLTKAQANAHVNHILGMKGGKTSLRNLFQDDTFMQDLEKAGGTDGMVLGAMTSDKFTNSHPDIANALNYHREQFVKDARDGKAGEYLGKNFADGVTTSSGRTVIDRSKGAFQDWSWYAQRPGMINAISHDLTGQLYKEISYNTASAAKSDTVAFGNADPGTQDMIEAIIAAGPPAAGSTVKNNLPTYAPNAPNKPDWLKFS